MKTEISDEEENITIDQGNSVIYITEQASINWTPEAADTFINLYAESQNLYYEGQLKTRRSVFDWISNELAKKGFYYHWTQCENKWKSVKRSFTNRAQKNPNILERPTKSDALLMKIFRREKNSPLEFVSSSEKSNDSFKEIRIHVQEEDSADELVDALVNNDDNYLDTLADCAEDMEDDQLKETSSEHAYSSNTPKKDTKETNQNQRKGRGVKRTAAELDLDLANEIVGLRNDLSIHHNENKEILRHNMTMQEKMLRLLTKMEKQKDEALEQKREEIEKQAMIAQQLKVQNSLLAKLVHHFINKE